MSIKFSSVAEGLEGGGAAADSVVGLAGDVVRADSREVALGLLIVVNEAIELAFGKSELDVERLSLAE